MVTLCVHPEEKDDLKGRLFRVSVVHRMRESQVSADTARRDVTLAVRCMQESVGDQFKHSESQRMCFGLSIQFLGVSSSVLGSCTASADPLDVLLLMALGAYQCVWLTPICGLCC